MNNFFEGLDGGCPTPSATIGACRRIVTSTNQNNGVPRSKTVLVAALKAGASFPARQP
jgi:hypothetical protein